jgi:hypothetical protein
VVYIDHLLLSAAGLREAALFMRSQEARRKQQGPEEIRESS